MHKQMTLATCLAFAAALPGSPAFGQQGVAPVSIVASVGHSEWCRAGMVRLDLGSGRYRVTAPPSWRACHRPTWRTPIRAGLLAARDLAAVRAAWRQADADGLEDPACGRVGQMQRVVISNGGASMLRVMRGARTLAPPVDEGCWSEAALRLHHLMREFFDPRAGR